MSFDELIREEVATNVAEQLSPALRDMFCDAIARVGKTLEKMQKYTAGDLLSEKQLAEYLGLSQQTLADWRMKKIGVPYVVIGEKTVRYKFEDVIEYVNRGKIRVSL